MSCEECSRLSSQVEAALSAYRAAVGGASGLHAYDLQFGQSQQRIDKARQHLERCRSALLDHQQHHKDIAAATD
jgi:hypothetical protein